jgi:hypothetical protein
MGTERRRAARHPVDVRARLLLEGGREAPVIVRNIGEMGALLSVPDLEVEVVEGERGLLEHPKMLDGKPQRATVRTAGAIVRVELDMDAGGILRQVAMYFDGGPAPKGAAA